MLFGRENSRKPPSRVLFMIKYLTFHSMKKYNDLLASLSFSGLIISRNSQNDSARYLVPVLLVIIVIW